VVPGCEDITHHASKESTEHGGAAFYWITDEPLCKYLGVTPTVNRFEPAHFTRDVSMLQPEQPCSLISWSFVQSHVRHGPDGTSGTIN